MTDTPRTNTFIDSVRTNVKHLALDDFGHYFEMTGELASFARQLERELTTEYQRGLNDGLEQAAGICGEKAAKLEDAWKRKTGIGPATDYSSIYRSLSEAIRAQIKK